MLKIFFKKPYFLFCLLIIFQLNVAYALTPSHDEDFGHWGAYDIEKKLGDRWKLKLGEELRFREHAGLYYAETRLGASYKICDYLVAGAEYQQIRSTRANGKKTIWYWDSVPRIHLTPQIKIKGFLLADRNMLEFHIKESARDTMRYRNMVTLTAPWKWTRFEFQPYASNEIFIETSRNGVVEDRFYSGFKMHWWGPVYGSIFYLRDSTKNSSGRWKALNVLGTSLKFSF